MILKQWVCELHSSGLLCSA